MNKQLWSILILIIGIISIWTFVITFFFVQDNTSPIDRHAYSEKIHIVKEDFTINVNQFNNDQKGKEAEINESVINLNYIVSKEENKKISIDTVLAALNNKYKE